MFLNNSNWLDYALDNYNTELNLKCEIYDDLKSINTIKKSVTLCNEQNSDLHVRILINNILVLVNVFGVECSFNLLLFKIDKEFYSIIKTCYYYLRLINNELDNVKILVDENIKDIELDRNVLQKLYSL